MSPRKSSPDFINYYLISGLISNKFGFIYVNSIQSAMFRKKLNL